MRTRSVALALVAAAVAAALVWRRRRASAPAEPLVQLGLRGGAVLALDRSDPSTADLETLAAGVRDSLTGGA